MWTGVRELLLVALVILLLFNAKKVPEIGRALGKAIKEFKKAGKEIEGDIKDVTDDEEKGQS